MVSVCHDLMVVPLLPLLSQLVVIYYSDGCAASSIMVSICFQSHDSFIRLEFDNSLPINVCKNFFLYIMPVPGGPTHIYNKSGLGIGLRQSIAKIIWSLFIVTQRP